MENRIKKIMIDRNLVSSGEAETLDLPVLQVRHGWSLSDLPEWTSQFSLLSQVHYASLRNQHVHAYTQRTLIHDLTNPLMYVMNPVKHNQPSLYKCINYEYRPRALHGGRGGGDSGAQAKWSSQCVVWGNLGYFKPSLRKGLQGLLNIDRTESGLPVSLSI